MEVEDRLASLISRQRKERKELQALIQSLKKTAKNDKTKKKEITAEILKLESELDNRHKDEMELMQKEINIDNPASPTADREEQDNDNDNSIVKGDNSIPNVKEENNKKIKVSKAQKRRDKKSQLEHERQELIKQQEKDNLHGPRNIEIQAIIAKLKEKKLAIFPIPSDGDCLYKAVAHQLAVKRNRSISVDELRKIVSDYIRQNKEDFLPFMSNPETYETLTDEEFEAYCDKILTTKVWGGQLEIRALSNSLRCPINVIQATGPDTIAQGIEFDGDPLVISYHRHMYSLGEHYNSTCLYEGANTEIRET